MVERGGPLSLSRQCELLGIGRASLYRKPAGEGDANLALMRRMDGLYMEFPFHGSRQMSRHLRREGVVAGRHRVRRLMRLMGLEAACPKPCASAPRGSLPAKGTFQLWRKADIVHSGSRIHCHDSGAKPPVDGAAGTRHTDH